MSILTGFIPSSNKVESRTIKVSTSNDSPTHLISPSVLLNIASELLLTSIYMTMLQTLDLSESQGRLEDFCQYHSAQLSEPGQNKLKSAKKKAKSKKKLKRHEIRIKSADQVPKIMVVIGDSLIVRDFITNDLKPRFNLSIQNVPATMKRNAQTFKSQIFDGSQCNASFKENGFLGSTLFKVGESTDQ